MRQPSSIHPRRRAFMFSARVWNQVAIDEEALAAAPLP